MSSSKVMYFGVSSGIGVLLSFFIYLTLLNSGGFNLLVLEWDFSSRLGVDLSFTFVMDFISCSFVSVVLFISMSIVIFSGFYMSHEVFSYRFIYILMSFVLSMVLLVLVPSFLGMMVGWDGLGVTSFLLVIYYMDSYSLGAGMITALTNRVGDCFFVISLSLLSTCVSYNFLDIWFSKTKVFDLGLLGWLGIFLVLTSMTKSAVMPFSAWLPEAMAAPTPVSSLVHSSTLVTAGVYVLIRFNTLMSNFCFDFLFFFSIITVILSGMSAVQLVDAKKMIALSTLSQVSLMMLCIGAGAVGIAFFHLLVHAFFKALMFMCIGSVIFYSGGVQDVRFLGSLWYKMPFVFILFVSCNLSLVGFPFFSGYYSKELVVGATLGGCLSGLSVVLVLISLVFTLVYSLRMAWLVCNFKEVNPLTGFLSKNFFLDFSLLLMCLGGVVGSVFMQALTLNFSFYSMIWGVSFYSGLFYLFFLILNLLLIFMVFLPLAWKFNLKEFFGSLWFMKNLSGSFTSMGFLSLVFTIMKLVDMGWIRGFVWKKGLSSLTSFNVNKIRLFNSHSLGFIMFITSSVWILLFIFW